MRLSLIVGSVILLMVVVIAVFQHQPATAAHDQVLVAQANALPTIRAGEDADPSVRGGAPPIDQPKALGRSAVEVPAVVVGAGSAVSGAGVPNPIIQVTQAAPYGPIGPMMPYPGSPQWSEVDPETAELAGQDQQLEQEAQTLQRQLADSDDDKQRADLKGKLAAALEKQFDTQQKLRELEVTRIEARVKKLRDLIHKRTESRRKIIENRLEQLMNDAEGLGWNPSAKGGVQYVPQGGVGMPGYSARFAPQPANALPPQPVPPPRLQ